MQPRPATASARPPFDAQDWIRRARAIDRGLHATPTGLYRSIAGGDDLEEVRREEDRLDAELLDPAAHRAVWVEFLAWADQ